MHTISICQNCVYKTQPTQMYTGYCIVANCDLCGYFGELMMVARPCYCEEIRGIYPDSMCDFCTGLRKGVA